MSLPEVLDPEQNEGYGNWVLPCVRDQEITDEVERRLTGDHGSLSPASAPVLRAHAARMASLARREGDLDRVRTGLATVALASTIDVSRDLLVVLPLLWRSAEVLGADPTALFLAAADRVGGSETLEQFTERAPEDRSIASMGYVEVDDEDLGFHYERTW